MFVPYFIDFQARGRRNGSLLFSSRIFTLLFWVMLVFSALVFIFSSFFVTIMAPGFVDDPEKFDLAVRFTRITFPNVAFVALSTVYSGVLVSYEKFFPVAFAPIIVNIVLIFSLMAGSDIASAGYRISFGVLAAGIAQFIFLYFYTKRFRLPLPHITKIKLSNKTREFLKKLVPVVMGAGVAQINVFVDSLFCSFLPTGSISFMYFADRFIQLPLALFGISMATILLPKIAASIAKKDSPTDLQDNVAIFTLRLAIPSVIGLFALAHPLIGALYGHGKFSAFAVNSTATVLQIFAIGLPAYIMSKIFSSVLFAEKNSKTPVIAAVVSVVANIGLNCILISYLGVVGVAISTSVSGFVNAYVMYRKSRKWFVLDKTTIIALLKILLASSIMGICMQGASEAPDIMPEITHIANNTLLGIGIYVVFLLLLRDEVVIKMCKQILKTIKPS